MTAPLDPFRPFTAAQRRQRVVADPVYRRAPIAARALRREIREAGQRGVTLARLREEGREALSRLVAEQGGDPL